MQSKVLNVLHYFHIPQTTIELFKTIFNYEVVSENDEAVLLQVSEDLGGTLEIIKEKVELGQQGVGTVHHLALSIDNGDEDAWVSKLQAAGYRPTEVKDRKYFRSIYFREKGGILIELATVKPGVLVDESEENLGSELLIPPHYEIIREEIEATIMRLRSVKWINLKAMVIVICRIQLTSRKSTTKRRSSCLKKSKNLKCRRCLQDFRVKKSYNKS